MFPCCKCNLSLETVLLCPGDVSANGKKGFARDKMAGMSFSVSLQAAQNGYLEKKLAVGGIPYSPKPCLEPSLKAALEKTTANKPVFLAYRPQVDFSGKRDSHLPHLWHRSALGFQRDTTDLLVRVIR